MDSELQAAIDSAYQSYQSRPDYIVQRSWELGYSVEETAAWLLREQYMVDRAAIRSVFNYLSN